MLHREGQQCPRETAKAVAAEERTEETSSFVRTVKAASRRMYTPEEKIRIRYPTILQLAAGHLIALAQTIGARLRGLSIDEDGNRHGHSSITASYTML